MKIYPRLFKYISVETRYLKTNTDSIENIDLKKKCSYLDLDIPRLIPYNEEHVKKKKENFSSCCYSRVCLVQFPCTSFYTHRVWFPCMQLVCILCSSRAYDLCDSSAFLVHPPDDSSLCLSTEMVEISRVKARIFSLDWKGRMTRPRSPNP